MTMDLAAMVNPGSFRAQRKDSEKMLVDLTFKLANCLVAMNDTNATGQKKKVSLKAVGGTEMAYLLKYIALHNKIIEEVCRSKAAHK